MLMWLNGSPRSNVPIFCGKPRRLDGDHWWKGRDDVMSLLLVLLGTLFLLERRYNGMGGKNIGAGREEFQLN
jgi:hypothetical protein